MERWSRKKAWEWYDNQPWLRGCNFLPSDCCNRIALWQELDFEQHLATADRERVSARMMSLVQQSGRLYFQTDRTSRKYAQLCANPRIALCADNLQIEGICRELGLSTTSFSTLFKSVTGTTFIKYLNHYRIERAKDMLRCTDRPVGEVGEKVGFLSNAYFGLVFKNATGLSPNAYRKQYGGER